MQHSSQAKPGDPAEKVRYGRQRNKNEPPKQDNNKPKKPPRAPVEDDDDEDGDIATPKRDRHGNDDEPL